MIAMPVKFNKEDAPITPVFGKAKFVALIDKTTQKVDIKEIDFGSGRVLASWLAKNGVKTVIAQEMGANPYMALSGSGVEVYLAPKDRTTINSALELLKDGKLLQITPQNMAEHLDSGHHNHGGHEHHHEHHHGHGGGECCGSEHDHGDDCEHGHHKDGDRCCSGNEKRAEREHGHGEKCCGKHH